ncbi:hypothetical protein NQ166_00355 [Microbacterium sp. zg.Y1090]|uniref:hypothetical protein n=1 Tax=Microbacterium TaxID=33882 RepID=UPI00214B66D4|nr:MULTISPECIES: hypothetical protein [unclassified Microbacterium]MCR2812911.1 hypothetical protein [Microbacterium sp. zg.Y1084]MCR2817280.1 hypothetical protein [Microbacterium sp. zg.Y1090]MDL5486054.1 hypothetical protein [Microbacterium sp. zg-Y1211]WIM29231.1 hypothetical protein QNO26_04855 [Microbacterium sp. zg-Y1090]
MSRAGGGSPAPSSRAVAPGHRATVARRDDTLAPGPGDITVRSTFSVDLTHLVTAGLEGAGNGSAQPG